MTTTSGRVYGIEVVLQTGSGFRGEVMRMPPPLRDSPTQRVLTGTILKTDPKIFLKTNSAPIYTNLRRELAPKATIFQKVPKRSFWPVFPNYSALGWLSWPVKLIRLNIEKLIIFLKNNTNFLAADWLYSSYFVYFCSELKMGRNFVFGCVLVLFLSTENQVP